jgi:type IV pilus assembly protein PilM
MTRMHAEINRSINFYRSQQAGSKPARILLTGGSSIIPYTDTFLKEKLKVDVDYMNPFRNVAVSDSISADEIGGNAHLFGETVGLSLRRVLSCPIEINLMPRKVLQEKDFKRKQPLFFGAAAGIVLLLAVWSGFYFKMTHLAQARLKEISRHVDQLSRVEQRLQVTEGQMADVSGRMEVLENLIADRETWGTLLDAVHAQIREGMWLTELKPLFAKPENAPPGTPVVEGTIDSLEVAGYCYLDKARSENPILAFRDGLRTSELFTDETEIQWQPAPGTDDYVREFKILVVLQESISL